MNEVTGSGPSLQAEMYAVKKANETHGQNLMKVLDSASVEAAAQVNMQQRSQAAAQLTGIGQNLDIRA